MGIVILFFFFKQRAFPVEAKWECGQCKQWASQSSVQAGPYLNDWYPARSYRKTQGDYSLFKIKGPFLIPAWAGEGAAQLGLPSPGWRLKVPLSEFHWYQLNRFPACVSPAIIYFNAIWKMFLTLNLLNLCLISSLSCIRKHQSSHLCRMPGSPVSVIPSGLATHVKPAAFTKLAWHLSFFMLQIK